MTLATLPIDGVLPALAASLARTPNLVLVAEPGAGKTTRVPLALLDARWRADGRLILLEPRRLTARAAAQQMSRLIGEPVGATIGYRVRLDARVSAKTRIEVVTEGVFTRMILDDPSLDGVAAVLFDEFHERSLDADLGLALALDAQAGLREDLRLIVMSATLDAARVASLMGDAPVIRSEGRSFPVETRYRPRRPDERVEDAMAAACLDVLRDETGSILAFLPGAGEIERCARRLTERASPGVIIAPLYGALDPAAQDRAIERPPEGQRKVVLATSIAETSLTIDGVRVVIDSGLARVPRFEPSTGLTHLETTRVSQAAADQRRGRAGRLEPGICYRLWEEGQTRSLKPFSTPEILEADLSNLVIDCAEFGVTDPRKLAFLDPPPAPALAEARALLSSLDALDADGRLTPAGRSLSRLPLPPRLGHMLHRAAAAGEAGLAAEISVLLGERGLGGTETDLRQRLTRFRQDRGERARNARALAGRWAKLAGGGAGQADPDRAGPVLALAFPDRVAKARAPRSGEFLLVNGRGGALDPTDALAREPFLAIADLTGGEARARIQLAAPLTIKDIEADFSGQIVETMEFAFDRAAKAVRGRRFRRFGRLTLSEAPVPATGQEASAALMRGIRDLGLDVLPWTRATMQAVDRVRFLAQAAPDEWPDVSAERLLETLDDWLMPFIPGVFAVGDIGADALSTALDALLGPAKRRAEAEAPSHFVAPTGTHVPIDYDPDRGPVVAIRVQELFGLARHPSIAGGRIPLTFDLLSPAHRPIQTTRDLPGFWRGSWAGVRADMRGRYPKHPWPEDPANALPTTRAKPRGS